MSHPREEWLALEATGDLGWWRAALLRRHLAACPECAARIREYAGLSAELRAIEAPEPPAGLSAHILAAISLQQNASYRPRPAWAWIATSAVAALALVVVGYEFRAPEPSPVARDIRPTTPVIPAPAPTANTTPDEQAKNSVAPAVTARVVYTDLNQAEAARDKAFLAALATRQPAQVTEVLTRWTDAADQQQRVLPRTLGGARAEVLRTHSLPGRVEIVTLPGAPLQIVGAQASFAEGRLIDPTVEVKNTGTAALKDFQVVWVFRDASGNEYRGRITQGRRNVAAGERVQIAENLAFETSRTGPEAEIVSARVFLRSAEFADARVWVPERKALEAHSVGQFLPMAPGTHDLLASYRQHGMSALLAQLNQR